MSTLLQHQAFKGVEDICHTHAERLQWAMSSLTDLMPLTAERSSKLSPIELAIFDQFIVRFSKLQDAMGAKLLPMILEITHEQGDLSTFIDKLNRLEKIGAIPSTQQWLLLREMRNQFAHDYPEDPEIQASLLNKAFSQATILLDVFAHATAFAAKYIKE
ncbi:hypothetical protein [Nitrincola alkalilacustris]|uniref:hypothetical protein n=1 Tax=Nitrincola alkalilacustris TaxID=1571224 RepID=UPI00124C877D|nr:hypothetical protein [Nitrincola alkalilacustris]